MTTLWWLWLWMTTYRYLVMSSIACIGYLVASCYDQECRYMTTYLMMAMIVNDYRYHVMASIARIGLPCDGQECRYMTTLWWPDCKWLPVPCVGQYCMYRTTLWWPGMSGPGMYEQAGQQPRQVVQPRILLVQNSQLYQLVQQAQFQTVTIKKKHFWNISTVCRAGSVVEPDQFEASPAPDFPFEADPAPCWF